MSSLCSLSEVETLPNDFLSSFCYCTYYPKNHSIIILNFEKSTFYDDDDAKSGIHEYNLSTKEWSCLSNEFDSYTEAVRCYPENGIPEVLYAYIINDVLYALFTIEWWMKLNLITREYAPGCHQPGSDIPDFEKGYWSGDNRFSQPSNAFFVSQRNELHCVTWKDEYIVYDAMSLEPKSEKIECGFSSGAEFAYIDSKEYLMYVGGQSHSKVMSLALNDSTNTCRTIGNLPWVNHQYERIKYKTFLFDDVIVTLHRENGEIWCMDVKELPQNKWYKLRYPLKHSLCFVDKQENVHFLRLSDSVKEHVHVPIRELIPKKLKSERKKKYLPLVMGYLREKEKRLLDVDIAFALKCMIAEFFILYK